MIKIKKYLSLIRGSILEGLAFRTSMLVSIVSNILYLIIIYFLWKAIFASSATETVNGMTFYDTMIYLVLASAMFQFMDTFVVWTIGRDYQTGQIVEYLIKPIDYQAYIFYAGIGNCIVAFVITFLPTFLIVYFVTHGSIILGANLIYFMISIFFSIMVNYYVDFFVGTICLYTQSVWGVNIMKEVVVGLLSGATIPLAFFPEKFRYLIELLPFQAIYHSPLKILTDKSMSEFDYIRMLLMQLFWIMVTYTISRLFWKKSIRKIVINGG